MGVRENHPPLHPARRRRANPSHQGRGKLFFWLCATQENAKAAGFSDLPAAFDVFLRLRKLRRVNNQAQQAGPPPRGRPEKATGRAGSDSPSSASRPQNQALLILEKERTPAVRTPGRASLRSDLTLHPYFTSPCYYFFFSTFFVLLPHPQVLHMLVISFQPRILLSIECVVKTLCNRTRSTGLSEQRPATGWLSSGDAVFLVGRGAALLPIRVPFTPTSILPH